MADSNKFKVNYTVGEEFFNSITHAIGAGLSIAGLVISLLKTIGGEPIEIVSACIYGTTLIIMYLFSTLYHAIMHEKGKYVLRVFDHISIFLLIAGTYTPYTLITLKGTMIGVYLFTIIWLSAILGIVLKSISLERFKVITTFLYIVMGWVVVVAIKPLAMRLPFPGLVLLFVGGIVYTIGIIFYALKNFRFMHSIWHIFVLGGSILHFLSIVLFVF